MQQTPNTNKLKMTTQVQSRTAFNQVEIAYFTKLFKIEEGRSPSATAFKVPSLTPVASGFKSLQKRLNRLTSVTYLNGDIYRGELSIKGNQHGLGIMFYANGDILQARWKNNQAHGSGYYISKNKTELVGIWKNNMLHGKTNKVRFATGTEYVGNTECGEMRGQGTMEYSDGDIFRGTWANNKINGYVEIDYLDGNTYKGFMCNNEKCGFGIYTWTNGNIYKGFWYKDELHGDGIMGGRQHRHILRLGNRLLVLKHG